MLYTTTARSVARTFVCSAVLVALVTTPALAQKTMRVWEETPGLLKQAKVTPDSASRTALAKAPGGRVQKAEIEQEKGKLIYSFDIKVTGKTGITEVGVDAITGAVLSVEHEDAAAEAKEAKADKEKAEKERDAKAKAKVKKP